MIVYILIVISILLLGFIYSEKIENKMDRMLYTYDHPKLEIIEKIQTPYQKIILVEGKDEAKDWFVLYLNRYLQFYSRNESDAYHRAMVLPPLIIAKNHSSILILGGGDGLAARESLKYPNVKKITNVDLDPGILEFSKTNKKMVEFNEASFYDEKVDLVVMDAFQFVRKTDETYDLIFVDFPEGIDVPLARTYSTQFLNDLKRILNIGGVISIRADNYGTESYWSVVKAFREVGLYTIPYGTANEFYGTVYSEGMVLGSNSPIDYKKIDSQEDPVFEPLKNRASEEEIVEKTKDLELNTIYKPVYLYYFRKEFFNKYQVGN